MTRADNDFDRCGATDRFTALYDHAVEFPAERVAVSIDLYVHPSRSLGRCVSVSPVFSSEEEFRGGVLKRYAGSSSLWYQVDRVIVIVNPVTASQGLAMQVLASLADELEKAK